MSHGAPLHDTIAYLAPRWVPYGELALPVDDVGFLQAATAVERLRTHAQRLLEVDTHLRRFLRTAATLAIAGLPDQAALTDLIDQLLTRNAAWVAQQGDVGVTMFATPGLAVPAGRPTLGIHLTTLDHQAIQRRQRSGQPLVITDVRQPSPQCWPRGIKVRCRLHYYLADLQAQQIDADAVGILLDDDDTITETSVANLAIVRDGQIVSPPAHRVLPGVTQALAMQLAATAGISWQQQAVAVDEVLQADEVLLLGTTTGIWQGRIVGDATAGGRASPRGCDARRGPVCSALQQAYAEAVARA